MHRDRTAWCSCRLLEQLSEPSSAAGVAAPRALLVPGLAGDAPAIADLALTVTAVGAGGVAMVRRGRSMTTAPDASALIAFPERTRPSRTSKRTMAAPSFHQGDASG